MAMLWPRQRAASANRERMMSYVEENIQTKSRILQTISTDFEWNILQEKKKSGEGEEEERGEGEEEEDESKKKRRKKMSRRRRMKRRWFFALNLFFQVWNHPKAAWENRRVIFNILGTNGRVVPDGTAGLKMCKFPGCPHAVDVQDMMGGLDRADALPKVMPPAF